MDTTSGIGEIGINRLNGHLKIAEVQGYFHIKNIDSVYQTKKVCLT